MFASCNVVPDMDKPFGKLIKQYMHWPQRAKVGERVRKGVNVGEFDIIFLCNWFVLTTEK